MPPSLRCEASAEATSAVQCGTYPGVPGSKQALGEQLLKETVTV